ncbi:MAG: hypothetical protein ACYC9O_20485 [Candidatus Latescibacterota bacterium]
MNNKNEQIKNRKSKTHTRRFAMKAIIVIFALGLVYFVSTVNYLATCLVA